MGPTLAVVHPDDFVRLNNMIESVGGTIETTSALEAYGAELQAEIDESEVIKDNKAAARRVFINEHPKLRTAWCGHKVDPTRMPLSSNCPSCWGFWFMANREWTRNAASVLEQGYRAQLVSAHGNKMVKHLERFATAIGKGI